MIFFYSGYLTGDYHAHSHQQLQEAHGPREHVATHEHPGKLIFINFVSLNDHYLEIKFIYLELINSFFVYNFLFMYNNLQYQVFCLSYKKEL